MTTPAAGKTAAIPSGVAATDAVQLDPFVVQEDKLPDLKERQLLTPKGRLELAYKRHPGLRLGALPLGNDALALDTVEDEFARERRKEMDELYGLLRSAERVPPDVKRKVDEAKTRKNEWSHEAGTPFRAPK